MEVYKTNPKTGVSERFYEIQSRTGKTLNRSRNQRGIRRMVGTLPIQSVEVRKLYLGKINGPEAKLIIIFGRKQYPYLSNGWQDATYEIPFYSYSMLLEVVRRWRNLYGAPLIVNGYDTGTVVGSKNKFLQT